MLGVFDSRDVKTAACGCDQHRTTATSDLEQPTCFLAAVAHELIEISFGRAQLELGESGFEQRGDLLRAFQRVMNWESTG